MRYVSVSLSWLKIKKKTVWRRLHFGIFLLHFFITVSWLLRFVHLVFIKSCERTCSFRSYLWTDIVSDSFCWLSQLWVDFIAVSLSWLLRLWTGVVFVRCAGYHNQVFVRSAGYHKYEPTLSWFRWAGYHNLTGYGLRFVQLVTINMNRRCLGFVRLVIVTVNCCYVSSSPPPPPPFLFLSSSPLPSFFFSFSSSSTAEQEKSNQISKLKAFSFTALAGYASDIHAHICGQETVPKSYLFLRCLGFT